ncbi:MAG: cell division protein FtsX [Thermoanaerobaculia bacterium]
MPRDRAEPETPSSAFLYFLREAIRRIWVSKRTSFVAVAMISMSLLILGTFLLVSANLARGVAQWQGRSRMNVFFEPEANADQIRAVQVFLATHEDLSRTHFVPREEALARFKAHFTNLSDVVAQLDENPFPPSFDVDVTPATVQSAAFAHEVAALKKMPGVEQVQFDWEWLERLKRLVSIINLAGIIAGGVLAVAAAFTIANVIRLTMMLYHEEIEIMRLVGATERIIRGPFLIEGIVQGTLGAILAVGLLYGTFEAARHFMAPSASLLWGFMFLGFLPWQKIAALIAGGMLAGWVGSWLSVRESNEETA